MTKLQNIQQLADLELIEAYQSSQDKSYIGVLFQRYLHLVYGVCMKYFKNEDESKDAVMNIFEKLITDLNKHKIQNFKGWLHIVSKNHCLMELRKKPKLISGQDYHFVESNEYAHPAGENSEPSILKEQSLNNLEKSIEKLDSSQRICIELFYLKQLSYVEVAEQTGFNMNQVKSYLQNGKRNLKNLMDQYE